MKLAVVLLSVVAFVAAETIPQITSEFSPYGYLTKYGIPEAERIQKAEEEFLSRQDSRIVGGSPAAPAQFKYQAGLISDIVGLEPRRGVCGGSLITPNRVLTAAHCWSDGVNQAWRFTVVLGSNFLFTGGTRILTSDVTTHRFWFPLLIRNDIAVISLPENVPLSNTIGIVSLPLGDLSSETFEGEIATASGFGLTQDGGNIEPDQFLSYVRMPIISNSMCSFFFPIHITPANICTRTLGGTSTCRGDSGGPLTVQRNGESVLVGITSFGLGIACRLGFPAGFVRVSSHLDFINENI